MRECRFDAVVIGAGAAGMASAEALCSRGKKTLLVDREAEMGGILLQCIHNGFGLHRFGEELTGPEFAERLAVPLQKTGVLFYPDTTVVSISGEAGDFSLLLSSAARGLERISSCALVLAMGSRERNRGNIRLAGDRPAGIFTAGLAQRLLNIDGYIPGKKAVIIGSGDIGLIMARRLSLTGSTVSAVVEILPYASGLTRNIVQCLDDFSIPLLLSHSTVKIIGRERVEGVEIAPIENGAVNKSKSRLLECDTLLLSVGLVPENELSAKAGVAINTVTNGPLVDSRLMTSIPGIFACGNVLHIHDLADRVAHEAERAGKACADWLDASGVWKGGGESPLLAGKNVRYTVPSTIDFRVGGTVLMRSMVPIDRAVFTLDCASGTAFRKPLRWVRPGEMLEVEVGMLDLPPGQALTANLVPEAAS